MRPRSPTESPDRTAAAQNPGSGGRGGLLRLYGHHPAIRKHLVLRNTGTDPLRISHLNIEAIGIALGPENETTLLTQYGTIPREIFYTGRSEDAGLLVANGRTGHGMAILSEVPGDMKRTEIAGWDDPDMWASAFSTIPISCPSSARLPVERSSPRPASRWSPIATATASTIRIGCCLLTRRRCWSGAWTPRVRRGSTTPGSPSSAPSTTTK